MDQRLPTHPVSQKPVDVPLPPEPKTRDEFLKYYRRLTLDPNTAYREMVVSEGDRRAELTALVQSYPDHPDRFTHLYQVLCKEGLSGRRRHYWEVESKGSVEIAVAYKDLSRDGYFHECAFGCNDRSWSLDLNRHNDKCFRHNDVETTVIDLQGSRIGVYLDHTAGVLAYYGVTDASMTLVHRAQTTFTRPLYPGLWVAEWAELCDLDSGGK